jgi:hypothetical protein
MGELLELVDLILGGVLEKRRERKALSEQFGALKRRVIYENVANTLPVHLAKLRGLLLDSGLVSEPKFKAFFDRWLTHPYVAKGQPVPGLFSKDQIDELKRELSCLEL